ncbi:MAG: alpha/beta hydrolase [Thaumarchaeota archaeon]|nr:alpha/beta hydrolase [Nitrososphaerota archaeon]
MVGSFFRTSMASLHYQTTGSGSPVVLVHGITGSLADWRWIVPLLARKLQVVSVDLPGFGRSEKPDVVYDLDFFANALREFVTGLGLPKPTLVGHSLGGRVVVRTVLKNPGLFSKLILVCSSGGIVNSPPKAIYDHSSELRRLGTRESIRQMLELAMHDPSKIPAELVEEDYRLFNLPGSTRAYDATVNRPRKDEGDASASMMSSLELPFLVVAARQDRNVPWELCQRVAKTVHGAVFKIIEDSGHFPMLEQPSVLAEEIIRFS